VTEQSGPPSGAAPTTLTATGGWPQIPEENLQAGFSDPHEVMLNGTGGPVDVSYLGAPCVGWAPTNPSYRVDWSGNTGFLRIGVNAGNNGDTTLVVRDPSGTWHCDDDSYGSNPAVDFSNPAAGKYNIWVGTYSQGVSFPATIYLTEYPNVHP
jgi:hypothetical protein